jgi:hypothetical protein
MAVIDPQLTHRSRGDAIGSRTGGAMGAARAYVGMAGRGDTGGGGAGAGVGEGAGDGAIATLGAGVGAGAGGTGGDGRGGGATGLGVAFAGAAGSGGGAWYCGIAEAGGSGKVTSVSPGRRSTVPVRGCFAAGALADGVAAAMPPGLAGIKPTM